MILRPRIGKRWVSEKSLIRQTFRNAITASVSCWFARKGRINSDLSGLSLPSPASYVTLSSLLFKVSIANNRDNLLKQTFFYKEQDCVCSWTSLQPSILQQIDSQGEEDLEQRDSVQTDHFEKCEFSLCSLNKERRVVVEKLAGYQKSE